MLNSILKEIKPSKEEERYASEVVSEILKVINKISRGKAEVGGSGAKETWLSGTREVDIFVKFNLKYKEKNISEMLEKDLKKKFKMDRLHGSRDYFQIKYKGYIFEIIPVLDIKKVQNAVNITDVSPFHALWVKKHKKYADEIRLIKQFSKAQKVYGAESYLRGFSGYVLEILTIHYKGFKSLIKNAAKWKAKTIIDTEKLLKNPLSELNESKIVSPLIVVDPVDKTRNAAASLSDKNFKIFIEACRKFIKKPSKNFFKIKKEKTPEGSILLKVNLKGKIDVVGAKILKLFEYISQKLKKEGYRFRGGWNLEGIVWFKVSNEKLGKFKILQGPPAKFENAVVNFRKKHRKIFKKGSRYYTRVKREHPHAADFIKNLIKNKEVKNRFNIKIR